MSKKRKTILSIDGGGIRGLIPATILAEIESRAFIYIRDRINGPNGPEEEEQRKELNAALDHLTQTRKETQTGKEKKNIPTAELFDMIAGSSTGGILALGLVKKDSEEKPEHLAEDLVKLYTEKGPKIFRRSFWKKATQLLAAKYSSKELRKALDKFFNGARLSQAFCDVIITSYEIKKSIPWFFKSNPPEGKNKEAYDFSMTDVALATSAAPTYFKPHKMSVTANGEKYEGKFVDGGIYANHPAMCAFVEARTQCPKAKILLVSLGTGAHAPFSRPNQKRRWGIFSWSKRNRLINIIIDGASDTVNYQLDRLLTKLGNGRFYRLQLDLPKNRADLDNAEQGNLDALQELAKKLMKTDKKFDDLCDAVFDELYERLQRTGNHTDEP